eukprot:4174779-Karenia_brevis.AAC.1
MVMMMMMMMVTMTTTMTTMTVMMIYGVRWPPGPNDVRFEDAVAGFVSLDRWTVGDAAFSH